MKKLSFGFLLFLGVMSVALFGFLSSCANRGSEKQSSYETARFAADSGSEPQWLPPMQVPFRILEQYFVHAKALDSGELKLESKGQFEQMFSPAATMGGTGSTSKISFDREFVIAVVLPETSRATELQAVSLQRISDGALLFTYKVIKGDQQTFTIRPSLAVVVEKQFDDQVVFREVQE